MEVKFYHVINMLVNFGTYTAQSLFKDTHCHIKSCRSLKRRAILKIPSTVF